MTTLRTAAVVAALLASGFTAERLASQGGVAADPSTSEPVASPAVASSAVAAAGPPSPEAPSPEAPSPEAPSPEAPSPEAPLAVGPRLPMGPVQGVVSSPFGPRAHPVSGRASHHDGVDLAVPAGTAVWTVAPGTVYAVGRRPGYGLVVEIDHPGGIRGSEPVRTRYAHLASVDAALRPGFRVGRGVAIGASGGRPGRDGVSTGAHLHFEVRDDRGRPLDPARFVRLPGAATAAPRWTAGPSGPGPRDPPAAAPAAGPDPAAGGPDVDPPDVPEPDLPPP
ncbi:M23 family metallopeptidase, partial [Rubrivirga marina]